MADYLVGQFLVFFILMSAGFAQVDGPYMTGQLGEKKLDSYWERYQPLIFQDTYQGKLAFEDELFFQNYFQNYIFSGKELSFFLRSELGAGLVCPNEVYSNHYEDLRYSYRLITLSYLLEGQWHMKMASDHFRLKGGCAFDLQKWLGPCRPASLAMKKFLGRLKKFSPKYEDGFPLAYKKEDWWKEYSSGNFRHYSQYKMDSYCKTKCPQEDMAAKFKLTCQENEELMGLICSEKDELYGLSAHRDAYYLIGQSNIINTYNKRGEAMGCLRRFSEMLSHREVKYPPLHLLFPVLQAGLREKYQERFVQGRAFFYGASKEFEDKGLSEVFVEDQTLKIATVKAFSDSAPMPVEKALEGPKPPAKKTGTVKVTQIQKKKEVVEIKAPIKSAFLQAAEIRSLGNLPLVEVDMLKLKYDYVFTLNMMNTLSERLKTFMTRPALMEMMTYDKLGTSKGPVPLLFLKYMIDMQEHQGLWNLISVLGEKFYVSNEIDSSFKPAPEYVRIMNNENTGRQWQIFILRP